MPRTLHLEIITPQKKIFSGEIVDFTAPGILGRFEILRNHTAFFSFISIGEVRLRRANGEEDFYATSGGYVEVLNNNALFLAETCEKVEEIDVTRAKEALQRAQIRIDDSSGYEADRARQALARAKNRIRLVEKRYRE